MRSSTLVLVLIVAISAAACADSTGPHWVQLAELEQQQSVWQSQNLHNYSFEYHHQFAGAIEAARILVEADTVVGALDIEADTALSIDPRYEWPAVEDLFARAKAALSSEKVDVTVEYDPALGYPTRIDISPGRVATPAGGSSTTASDLEPVYLPGGEQAQRR